MNDTPNLLLPYILAAQSQKHVTHNEAVRALDCVVQLAVLDRDLAAPPVTPAEGDRYIVAASPTGTWAGQTKKIAAYQDAAWLFYAAKEGWIAWIADENIAVVFDGSDWTPLTSGGGSVSEHDANAMISTGVYQYETTGPAVVNGPAGETDGSVFVCRHPSTSSHLTQLYISLTSDKVFFRRRLGTVFQSWFQISGGGVTDHSALTGLAADDHPQYHNNARGDARYTMLNPTTLGVNATADTTNRLAVGSAASLFNHAGTGGHQIKVNKALAADTASFLFQTGFSGRAEIGTTGDDDFHFKVSADGTTFFEAIKIIKGTGEVRLPLTDCDIQVYTAPGAATWTKPVWANANSVVEIHDMGAGGGGGSGRRGAAASVRCGGGGGASGTYATIRTRAGLLGVTVAVTVGAGGTGGAGQTVNSTNGNNGTAGGNSLFGTIRALGGNPGSGGSATSGVGGASLGVTTPFSVVSSAGGAASTTGGVGGAGQGGAASISSGAGAGGGITTANAASGGGAGAAYTSNFSTVTAPGGVPAGAGGGGGSGSPAIFTFGVSMGTGGGGGGSSSVAGAGIGGAGEVGAGGAGGGASLDGFNSGAGGNGGNGWVVVVTYR